MVKTRSKGGNKGRDKTSSPNINSLNHKHTPISKPSHSKKNNSSSNTTAPSPLRKASNTTAPSPLRRSTRDTPKKRTPDLTASASAPSPTSTKNRNSNLTAQQSAKKTASMEKKKLVSVGSSSGTESLKNKSKGKDKVQADGENTQTCKRNLKSISNSSSPLPAKEEGSLTKRQRLLMHAKAYKELFKPRPKTSKSSQMHAKDCKELFKPDPMMIKPSLPVEISEAVKAVEAVADEDTSERVDSHAMVDGPVIEGSYLREYPSDLKSANEATTYAPEATTSSKVSENDVKTLVVSVAENREESSSDEMKCEILSAENKMDDLPDAGSTGEVDPGVAAISGVDNLDVSKEHQACEKFVPNACFACREPGVLLCCEGKNCKRTYHPSCLDPPLQSSPPGAWLCLSCIQKKIQSDVCAVFDDIECIWDAKDARTENGKLYFVKYKNLAHLYNRWIPEAEVAVQAPELLSKFNWKMLKEKNPPRWKLEWTEPQRLLMKRHLMSDRVATEFYDGLGGSLPFCNAEWLVKWRDLGYEHATWELETAPFLCTEEGGALIKAFESRRQQGQLSSFPQRISKALEVKQSALDKLDKLPDSFPPGLDSEHLHSVNQLRLFWHKSQNAVFIDEQERVIKTILFIMTVIEDICRPILIVSSVGSLPLWESKFQRLAPSINVVSYAGSKPVRKLIRDVEFYEESGCIMFQVLLSHPDAMVEDFEMLDSIGWETVIIDECQNLRISKHLEKFKNLSADFRLLLLSSPLKDNVSEYVNMLSYLDPNNGIGDTCLTKNTMLAHFKEKLGNHVVYERKDETCKVVEYWVPARFSNVQLELYCSTLLSNSFALRSSSKNDQVGALRNMLISLRKCCDHPYLVYPELQAALTKERPITEILNIGVYASGKLLLLDKLLHEMQLRGLRVIIVFQAGGGSGRNQIGDFLDDFLRQRFGQEAYEHVERGLLPSKKQVAMNNFNDKSKGRFVFLVENRACQPSLKLSAVDAVLIFDSDWNPMNDSRSLQKINIQPEQVPVFRFYSPCAVEEKVLSLARQDVFLDSTLQGVVAAVSHSLLSWGAEHLFSLLHQLSLQPDDACDDYRSAYVSQENMAFVDTVITEVIDRVCGKSNGARATSLLVEARPTGESYSHDSGLLIGEKEGVSSLHGESLVFWSALLEGKNPQWRFIQSDGPSQRSRRKVRPFDNSEKPLMAEPSGTEEPSKKKKKIGADASIGSLGTILPREKTGTHVSATNPCAAVVTWDDLSGFSAGPSEQEISNQAAALTSVEVGANLRSMQKDIHLLLEPQLVNLCESAGFPEYVKIMARMLLDYVMNNFKVDDGGDAVILQTLVISLCWRAASLLKLWIDPVQLTALASKVLQYNCKCNVVESVYRRLKILKVEFQEKADAMVASQTLCIRFYNKLFKVPKQEVIILTESPPLEEEIIESPVPTPGQSPCAIETQTDSGGSKEKLLNARLDLIEKLCTRREENLLTKQQQEVSELEQFKEREKIRLRKEHQIQVERLSDSSVEEMAKVKEEFERRMLAFDVHVGKERERLQALHMVARELERGIKERWVGRSKLGILEDDFYNVPLSDCGGFIVQEFNWDPSTTSLIHGDNMDERASGGDIAAGLLNYTSSPTPQESEVLAEEVMPFGAVVQGGTATESASHHKDGDNFLVEGEQHTMMEEESQSAAGSTKPAGTAESILPVEPVGSVPPAETTESTTYESAESIPPGEEAESTQHTDIPESTLHAEARESTPRAEATEVTPRAEATEATPRAEATESTQRAEATESTPRAEATESTPHAKATESTPHAEATDSTPHAEATESTPHAEATESTPHAEATESTPHAEATESTPHAEATESTPHAEATESTPHAEATDLTPHAEATESTPHAEATESVPCLAAVTRPAVADVMIANGDTVVSTLDTLRPSDHLASTPRDTAPHSLPQQNLGLLPQNQLPSPVLFHNVGMQSSQFNSNGVWNGHETSIENGTTVGIRSEVNYNALWQMLPLASPSVFPHGLYADPLRNELTRIKQQEDILARRYEAKKMQLKMELEEEMERIRRRYEEMLQEEDNTFQQQKQHLEHVYKKVLLNQTLAEEFRAKFIEHKAPSASTSASASSQLRSQVPGSRPQLPLQHRGPQQIQRTPPAATAPREGSGIANRPLSQPINSRIPSSLPLHIPSTSTLRPSAPSPSLSRAPFSSVTLPARPGTALRSEQRAPAPHLARARSHISASVPTSTPSRVAGSVAATTMEQLQSLLARSQEGTSSRAETEIQSLPVESLLSSWSQELAAASSQSQAQNVPKPLIPSLQENTVGPIEIQTQNLTMQASVGNNKGSEQVVVGDDVVCLSDDD